MSPERARKRYAYWAIVSTTWPEILEADRWLYDIALSLDLDNALATQFPYRGPSSLLRGESLA